LLRRKAPRRLEGRHEGAGDTVADVVVTARAMVYAVTPTARGAPLKPRQLVDQSVIIKKVNSTAIEQWQQVNIDL